MTKVIKKLKIFLAWISFRMKFDKGNKKNSLAEFLFIYGKKRKACKSVKSSCALILFSRERSGNGGKKIQKIAL